MNPRHDDARLDAALADTFPASDPPAHMHGDTGPVSARDAWQSIDQLDAAGFGKHLTTGARLAWGHANAEGREEVERWLAGWLGGLRSVRHTITSEHHVGDACILETEAACERLDGHQATIKAAIVLRPAQPPFEDVRVYCDLTPLTS